MVETDTQILINKKVGADEKERVRGKKEEAKAFEKELEKVIEEKAALTPPKVFDFTPVRAYIPD